jgi:hypothetical protein
MAARPQVNLEIQLAMREEHAEPKQKEVRVREMNEMVSWLYQKEFMRL